MAAHGDAADMFLVKNPELFTSVGIADGTMWDHHSGKLAPVGIEKRNADYAFADQALTDVRKFDRAKLGPQDQITYDILLDFYGEQVAFRSFDWMSSEGIYPISPMRTRAVCAAPRAQSDGAYRADC